jgi:hypothetical protein
LFGRLVGWLVGWLLVSLFDLKLGGWGFKHRLFRVTPVRVEKRKKKRRKNSLLRFLYLRNLFTKNKISNVAARLCLASTAFLCLGKKTIQTTKKQLFMRFR